MGFDSSSGSSDPTISRKLSGAKCWRVTVEGQHSYHLRTVNRVMGVGDNSLYMSSNCQALRVRWSAEIFLKLLPTYPKPNLACWLKIKGPKHAVLTIVVAQIF